MQLTSWRRAGAARRRHRGIGLIDALIALSMLAFGMLGLTRMQGRLIAQGSEAQARLVATRAADELLGMVAADSANAACYTVPATASCGSTVASATATTWKSAALALLPTLAGTAPTATVTLDSATGRFQVTLTWPAKVQRLGDQLLADTHTVTVSTDVRQ